MGHENEVVEEVLQFEKDLVFVRDFLDKLPKTLNHLEEALNRLNGEQLDLLHYMEFRRLSAKDGYEAYKMMHEVQNERRKVKDTLEVVKVTNDKLKNKLPNIAVFNGAVGEIRGIISKHKTRKYKPRELYDISYGNHVREDLVEQNT